MRRLLFYSILLLSVSIFSQKNIQKTNLYTTEETISIPDIEYQALVDFYDAANGKNWNTKWNTTENNLHEGAWPGVTIENGHITGLSISESFLQGEIPLSFGNLKFLKKLDLYGHYYYGDLSKTNLNVLSDLENLESLSIIYAKLEGDIPSSWSKLKNLKTLNLSYNNIVSLPEELGEIESLQTIELSANQLKSIPKTIGNLKNLVTLNLYNNLIEGTLIKELENIGSLTSLNISNNKLTDIEAFLDSKVRLSLNSQKLSIDNLVYKGEDLKIDKLPNIVYYNRSKNDFSERNIFRLYLRDSDMGTITVSEDQSIIIPVPYLSTLKKGDKVYLRQNNGTAYSTEIHLENLTIDQAKIPDIEYQALVDFYDATNGKNWNTKWNTTENNLHEGAWPGVTIENGHITGLSISESFLQGEIPLSFGNLKFLKKLDLYGHYYYGDLSKTNLNVLSDLENLELLSIIYAKLEGDIPSSWSKLKKLKTLNLSYNNIVSLPEELGEIESLQTIELSANQLKSIPKTIGNLKNLVTLNLYNNLIEGTLIKELENIGSLTSLNISNNKLTDIEAFLDSKVRLSLNSQKLSIDNLVYKGEDLKIDKLPNIVYYNRSKNDFSERNIFRLYLRDSDMGTITVSEDQSIIIPASYLSTLKKGDKVYLRQNNGTAYSTEIHLENLTIDQAKIPDIEYQALVDFYDAANGKNWNTKWNTTENNLHEGAWPGVTIENGHITGLSISESFLQGEIPLSFGNLKFLKKLDLYGHYYYGDLSKTNLNVLSDLENLELLSIIYAKLEGDIPSSWSKLKNLKTLNLSYNNIVSLPEELGEIESLQTIELSANQLKSIPKTIGNLKNLVTLNLYNNLIEGTLIKELENIGSLTSLNISNNKLTDIEAFLDSKVRLSLNSQKLSIDNLVYKGEDLKIDKLPNIVYYNRSKNDFSERNIFRLYLRDSDMGTITVSEDQSIIIPVPYLSTLKKGDKVYLRQNNGTAYSTEIHLENLTIDQAKIPDIEYQALVDFYDATNGKNWNTKWNTTENNLHEGAWPGVTIENGHITGLSISESFLQGEIPLSFGNLKFLKKLDLYGHYYYGDLSKTNLNVLSDLENLELLSIIYAKLEGDIPSSWSKLKKLKTLNLSYNNVNNVDESILTLALNKVDLSNQTINEENIEVGIDELIIELPHLSTYGISEDKGSFNNINYFSLYINNAKKRENYSNKDGKLIFKDINTLDLKLTDKIKIVQNSGIANGTSIHYGEISFGKPLEAAEYEILKKLYNSTNGTKWTQKWDINENNLHEINWYGVGTKDGHVISLNLANNNLSGILPQELSGLKYLKTLDLQTNIIEGNIPTTVSELISLETLNLQSNKLKGEIPRSISKIKTLKKLSVADNKFGSKIPIEFNQFENIEYLDLSKNAFETVETAFTYDLGKVHLNLRDQYIVKDEYLNLEESEVTLNLPNISVYNDANQDFDEDNIFALKINNLTIKEVISENGMLTFKEVVLPENSSDTKITIWQRTGTAKGSELEYAGIKDGSNVPVLEEEYQALIQFYKKSNGTEWAQKWDISSNNLHEKKWKGITTNDGHIIKINLSDNNLSGSISKELSKLPELKFIDLSVNSLSGLEEKLPSEIDFRIDRQNVDLGVLDLTLNSVIKDNTLNRYDHLKGMFTNQSYNLSIGNYSKMVTLPEEGIKLVDLIKEWNVPNGQNIELRQIAGSARHSVITYTLNYKMGDTNLDGVINILDIQSSLNYILNENRGYFNFGAADLNADKTINLLDIILLVDKIQNESIEDEKENRKLKRTVNQASLSIENGVLYLESPYQETAAFDIRLKGILKEQVKELLSRQGYNIHIGNQNNVTSIIGFTLDKTLSDKIAIAEVNQETEILNALLSDKQAQAIPYAIKNSSFLETSDNSNLINLPNPFKEKTTIRYYLNEKAESIVLKVFNNQGQLVRIQSNLNTSKGRHEIMFLRENLTVGVYYYVLEMRTESQVKQYKSKMLIK